MRSFGDQQAAAASVEHRRKKKGEFSKSDDAHAVIQLTAGVRKHWSLSRLWTARKSELTVKAPARPRAFSHLLFRRGEKACRASHLVAFVSVMFSRRVESEAAGRPIEALTHQGDGWRLNCRVNGTRSFSRPLRTTFICFRSFLSRAGKLLVAALVLCVYPSLRKKRNELGPISCPLDSAPIVCRPLNAISSGDRPGNGAPARLVLFRRHTYPVKRVGPLTRALVITAICTCCLRARVDSRGRVVKQETPHSSPVKFSKVASCLLYLLLCKQPDYLSSYATSLESYQVENHLFCIYL